MGFACALYELCIYFVYLCMCCICALMRSLPLQVFCMCFVRALWLRPWVSQVRAHVSSGDLSLVPSLHIQSLFQSIQSQSLTDCRCRRLMKVERFQRFQDGWNYMLLGQVLMENPSPQQLPSTARYDQNMTWPMIEHLSRKSLRDMQRKQCHSPAHSDTADSHSQKK